MSTKATVVFRITGAENNKMKILEVDCSTNQSVIAAVLGDGRLKNKGQVDFWEALDPADDTWVPITADKNPPYERGGVVGVRLTMSGAGGGGGVAGGVTGDRGGDIVSPDIQLFVIHGLNLPQGIKAPLTDTIQDLRRKICVLLGLGTKENWISLEVMAGPRILPLLSTLATENLSDKEVLRVLFIPPDVTNDAAIEGLTIQDIKGYTTQLKLTEHMDVASHGFIQLKEAKGRDENLTSVFAEDLCALANHVTTQFVKCGEYRLGYLVLGLCDSGAHAGASWTLEKAESREPTLAREIHRHLFPSPTVKVFPVGLGFKVENTQQEAGVVIIVVYPAPCVVFWDGKAYNQAGTSSYVMSDEEVGLWLSKLVPTLDFTAIPWQGNVDGALVLEFAKSMKLPILSQHSVDATLTHLGIRGTTTARILFGDVTAKVSFYDDTGHPYLSESFEGLFKLLTVGREAIQRASLKSQNVQLDAYTGGRILQLPYHPYVLREALVNAVIHCNYNVGKVGWPEIHVYHDHLVVKNAACTISEVMRRGWFAPRHYTVNERLANCMARYNDGPNTLLATQTVSLAELRGFGKQLIMRLVMQAYKLAPNVEISSEPHTVWTLTVHDGVVSDKDMTLFAAVQNTLVEIEKYDKNVRVDIFLALLAFRGASQNRFFEALTTDQRDFAKYLIGKDLSPCTINGSNLHPKGLEIINRTLENYLKELQFEYLPKRG